MKRDLHRHGDEADEDCGSSCPVKCAATQSCKGPDDCIDGVCSGNVCQKATCSDDVKNAAETDKDCGGGVCTTCGPLKSCGDDADCTGGSCVGNVCLPTCTDGVKNGGETDKDCGGGCATKCSTGSSCTSGAECASGLCTNGVCEVKASCKAWLAFNPAATSGIYEIDPDGAGPTSPSLTYCDMTTTGGGWTLAFKADGSKTTFLYQAALWTDASTFGGPALDANEAKLGAFNGVAFTEVRLELDTSGAKTSLTIPAVASSLSTLFSTSAPLALGRAAWKSLVPASSLQPNCNFEAINADPTGIYARVRIGIVGNQEEDCNSPDSWIGVGGYGDPCGNNGNISVGNIAGCEGDNGVAHIASFAWVFVR